jgi:hypothetical protein
VESEGSQRQNPAPRNTNIIRHKRGTSLHDKAKSNKRHGHGTVNDVVTWGESDSSYRGRSHGRAEQKQKHGRNKVYREKSAEAIVPGAGAKNGSGRAEHWEVRSK